MATATSKSTYSLDVATHDAIEKLAKRLSTSKSDVIRRAVKAMPAQEPAPDEDIKRRLTAARRLQKSLAARGMDFDEWMRVAYESRR